MRIALVGATGLVGSTMLSILADRKFPVTEIYPVASHKSKGRVIRYDGAEYPVFSIDEAIEQRPEIALLSAGSEVSLLYAPKLASIGCHVIDNSSAWRLHGGIKLIVPEVNGNTLTGSDRIIANPNCSTIQLVMVLEPLRRLFGIKRVIVSTYQSVSGSGNKGVAELNSQRRGSKAVSTYPHPIDLNVVPQVDSFTENGYTKEELKVINESRKILDDQDLAITCTAVRVPVTTCHSESVNIELLRDFHLDDVIMALNEFPGVTVLDDTSNGIYPLPLQAAGKDDVFVGRIRRDQSHPNTLNCWIVSDNLRKGAALNAVQIAEQFVETGVFP